MEKKFSHVEDQEVAKNFLFLTKNVLNNPSGTARSCAFFGRDERLKSEKIIGQLFKGGKAVHSSSLTLVYLPISLPTTFPAQAMFSVPKKCFKNAVDRNRLKRQMREAYRLKKNDFYQTLSLSKQPIQLAICWVYKSKSKQPFANIAAEMNKLTQTMFQRLH